MLVVVVFIAVLAMPVLLSTVLMLLVLILLVLIALLLLFILKADVNGVYICDTGMAKAGGVADISVNGIDI